MVDISDSKWAELDASNNSAAPDGWASSTMLPTQVEPTGRAMMGAIKRFWDRIQGVNASTGSANAYVVTPSVPLGAYVTGERYSFRSNFANTGAATLNISGLGAKTLKKMTASGKADLASGDIQSGQPVTVEYDGTDLIVTTAIAVIANSQLAQMAANTIKGNNTVSTANPLDLTIAQVQAMLFAAGSSYTPVLASGTGSLTTTTNLIGRYMQMGKLVLFSASGDITTNGTGASFLALSLPVQAAALVFPISGLNNTDGISMVAVINSGASIATFLKYDGTYPGINGKTYTVGGVYESV